MKTLCSPKYWCYNFAKDIFWIFFRVGFGLEVRGIEHVPKTGAFIVASNHVSFLDPPVIGAACPRRLCFMARADLYQRPMLAMFLRAVRAIPVARGEADFRAIREALRRLRRGESLGIFPEGGRQRLGQLGRARRGVGLLAVSARVPIVPAIVRGTFEALPIDAQRLHRAKIRVVFGPQIPYTKPLSSTRVWQEQLADALSCQWQRLAEQLNQDG
jgi:1-acyl-sn-glycerol-3-phosphate acyltransferase